MGCFSFLCKVCGKQIVSDTDEVTLYLLKDGKVIQQMAGWYDSYGRVRSKKGDWRTNNLSAEWHLGEHGKTKILTEEEIGEDKKWEYWDDVCDLMFSSNKGDGIAAIHERCNDGSTPTTQSPDDPDQGCPLYNEE